MDELGIDTALRGARTDVSMLDDGLTVTLLAGVTNPVNLEAQRLRFTEDPDDRLAAARIEGRFDRLTLGAHVVGMRQELVPPDSPRPQTANYGVTADLTLGDVGVALEADGQARDLGTETATGLAIHGSATAHAERVTLLVEGKHYARFETLYSRMHGSCSYSPAPSAAASAASPARVVTSRRSRAFDWRPRFATDRGVTRAGDQEPSCTLCISPRLRGEYPREARGRRVLVSIARTFDLVISYTYARVSF